MTGKRCSDRGFSLFNQGFGAKAVCSDTTKTQAKTEDLVQTNMAALSSLEESFFFLSLSLSHSQRHAASGQDKTQLPHWWVLVCPLLLVPLNSQRRKPDNCWEPTARRSVGAADRWLTGMRVIKGREGESVLGQSGCDRGAACPLWPDTSYRWLTAGRPCLAVRCRSGAQQELCAADIIYRMYTSPRNHCIATNSIFPLATLTPGYTWQHKQ